MKPITKQYIKELFLEYNAQYFNNEIPVPAFSVFHRYFCYGFCTVTDKKARLWISSKVNWTEEGLKDVVIHEMIHLYVIVVQGHRVWGKLFAHGILFIRVLRKIRKKGVKVSWMCSDVYFKNEIIPTTVFGRLWRMFIGSRLNS